MASHLADPGRLMEHARAVVERMEGSLSKASRFYYDSLLGLCLAPVFEPLGGGAPGSGGGGMVYDVARIAACDFRLSPAVYSRRLTRDRELFDWSLIQGWYSGSTLLKHVTRDDAIMPRLMYKPYGERGPALVPMEGTVAAEQLEALRDRGVHVCVVSEDGQPLGLDRCLSMGLTGSGMYWGALRGAMMAELRAHAHVYTTAGTLGQDQRQRLLATLTASASPPGASGSAAGSAHGHGRHRAAAPTSRDDAVLALLRSLPPDHGR
jgi:hypothetical protein